MRPALHPEAEAELLEAIRYYNGKRQDLGWEFYSEIYDLLTAIGRNPARCGWDLDQVHRRCTTGRFPFSVVYRPDRKPVQVVAIYHQSRHPDYWRSRAS